MNVIMKHTRVAIFLAALLFSFPSNPFPYKSVEESSKKGLAWGGPKLIKKMKKIGRLWYPYAWKYGGGRDVGWISFLIMCC